MHQISLQQLLRNFSHNNKSQPHGHNHLASMANNSKKQMQSI